MQTILLVGLDDALLRSRAAVLRLTGCATVFATPTDAIAKQVLHGAKLVVLCHSVPEMMANILTQMFHDRWPGTRVLVVQKRSAPSLESSVIGADVVSYSDPERLLRSVSEEVGARQIPPVQVLKWRTSAYLH